VLTACNTSEEIADTQTNVSTQLALSVSQQSMTMTRQSGNVVQTTSIRPIDLLRIIPFATSGGSKVALGDEPKLFATTDGSLKEWFEKTDGTNQSRFYLSKDCRITSGTNAFLIYGRAHPVEGNAANGVLENTLSGEGTPESITFSLKQMCPDIAVPADAADMANYLTRIAQAEATVGGSVYSWKNSTHSLLKTLYRNFIGRHETLGTYLTMAGSSTNIHKHVGLLKEALENQGEHFVGDATADAIRQAILAQINNTEGMHDDYPTSLGLPDGAAVLQFDGDNNRFVPQVETSTTASINNINRYCYPAELYYYTNSPIKTAVKDISSNEYKDDYVITWQSVLDKYNAGGVVTENTKAVAIVNPMQYAVACLQIKLKKVPATLKDSQGNNITVTEKAFPLTGIIVSGQHTVDFDFKPQKDENMLLSPERFIFDNQVKTNTNTADGTSDYFYLSPTIDESAPTQTLVLQSDESDADVNIILEFENNSDTDFYGAQNGIIYRGTKFYLTAKVSRPDERTKDFENRVFTQDFTTSLSMKVESLVHAYNVLPDVLAPSLEVGIQVTRKWIQSTTTTVAL
jgi:hypothetical protein